MRLRTIREPSADLTTLGALYVDDVWQCWTLEDQIRERAGVPVTEWKIAGETAIPAGLYRVRLSFSHRFGKVTPELLDVRGFTAIRSHWGNKRKDTEGCILVGRHRGSAAIFESVLAWEALMRRLVEAPDGSITWLVENPPGYLAEAV